MKVINKSESDLVEMTVFHGPLIDDTNFNSSYYRSITSEWEGIVLAIYCTIVFIFGLAGKKWSRLKETVVITAKFILAENNRAL